MASTREKPKRPTKKRKPATRRPAKPASRRGPSVSSKKPTPEAVLSCTGLLKRFGGRTAVDGVTFEIAAGETYGLLGPNGAGKTTTVSMICGLLDRDGGEVIVAGRKISPSATKAKAAIGLVPQEIALYPDLSGKENLRFFGHLYGLTGNELMERVEHVLDVVGLTDRAAERVDKYSGGMQRRLNIAAGLLHSPKLLILDEPTVGVDPQSRNAILENVQTLASQGTSVLYTTHYMEEAERLCDRVGIIDEGKLVAEGTRRELVSRIGQKDRVEITGTGRLDRLATQAKRLRDVDDATAGDGSVSLLVRAGRQLLPKLIELADRTSVDVTSVEVVEPDLEAVFLSLTGKALRD